MAVTDSLLQDQILGDAEETLQRHGGDATLDQLHREARKLNLEASRGRMNTDWIEPETLFWAAWQVLPAGEKAALAREAIGGFLERVRAGRRDGPAAGRNTTTRWSGIAIASIRCCGKRWKMRQPTDGRTTRCDKELKAWQAKQDEYLARRPMWSQVEEISAAVGGEGEGSQVAAAASESFSRRRVKCSTILRLPLQELEEGRPSIV